MERAQVLLNLLDERTAESLDTNRCGPVRKSILIIEYEVKKVVLPGISNRRLPIRSSFSGESGEEQGIGRGKFSGMLPGLRWVMGDQIQELDHPGNHGVLQDLAVDDQTGG